MYIYFFCQKWPTKKCCSHRALNNFKVAWTPCIKVLPGMVEPGWMDIACLCEKKFRSCKGVWGDIPQLPCRFERERGDFFPSFQTRCPIHLPSPGQPPLIAPHTLPPPSGRKSIYSKKWELLHPLWHKMVKWPAVGTAVIGLKWN